MRHRHFALALSALALAAASFAANAGIVFTNLGTSAPPPASLGSHAMTPFSLAPQAAITEFSSVSVVPGNPVAGNLTLSPSGAKYTAGATWGSLWPGGYTGAVYFVPADPITLTLPPNTKAFYLYAQGNNIGTNVFTVTTDAGATSGPVSVVSAFNTEGATGFAFHTTAGESIVSISVSAPTAGGAAVGQFGINTGTIAPAKTCASEGYTGTKLTWCKNICEMGYTGATLDIWIHRWINRYRDLPYCAQEGGGEEEPPPQET